MRREGRRKEKTSKKENEIIVEQKNKQDSLSLFLFRAGNESTRKKATFL